MVNRNGRWDAAGTSLMMRAGVDVEELEAAELTLADVALDVLLEQGGLPPVVVGDAPAHGHVVRLGENGLEVEHMFV